MQMPPLSRRRLQFSEKFAILAFLLIFPSHIGYQMLVKSGVIPAFLGGYFTASTLMATPLVLTASLFSARLRMDLNQWLFGAFLLLFGATIAMGMLHGAAPEITAPHLAFLLKFACFYFLAALLPWEKARFQSLCRWLVAITVLVVFANVYFFGNAFISTVHLDGREMDYQGVAFAYLVMFMGGVQGAPWRTRFVLYAASVFALFHIGARAEFLALPVLALVLEYHLARSKPLFVLKALAVLLLAAGLMAALKGGADANRIVQLTELGADQSYIERKQLQTDAIETIMQYPLSGHYASYSPGDYAHNLLSTWVDLGLSGFVLLNALFLIALWDVYRRLGRSALKQVWLPAFALLVATYFLLISAKSYTYQLVPIALGAYLHMRSCYPRQHPTAVTA